MAATVPTPAATSKACLDGLAALNSSINLDNIVAGVPDGNGNAYSLEQVMNIHSEATTTKVTGDRCCLVNSVLQCC